MSETILDSVSYSEQIRDDYDNKLFDEILVEIGIEPEEKQLVDSNDMYDAFRASLKGSSWKQEPQKFERDWLGENLKLKKEMISGQYVPLKGSEFILNERGKTRYVHGGRMRDRVVGHWICDTQINPRIQPYLIYNNGASQKGKGLSFTREQFEADLHNYYLKHGNNKGCIGFVDMSKFYDNIRHDVAKNMLQCMISGFAHGIFSSILKTFRIDVSYMSDEEFEGCEDKLFNSIEYHEKISEKQKTGKKFMNKSANIGDQISQSIGMFYPIPIDNYATIVRGAEGYGRYMDDLYIIAETKEEVQSIIDGIIKIAEMLGLFINKKKTKIVRLCDHYQFLQIKYTLSEDGKVIKKINPKTVTRERRKLKAYKRLLLRGEITEEAIECAYKSWMGTFARLMSKKQISHMKALYKKLFGKEIKWKRK